MLKSGSEWVSDKWIMIKRFLCAAAEDDFATQKVRVRSKQDNMVNIS